MYNWDDVQEECRTLYCDEKRSLDEVMDHLKTSHGFTPSKRAYQTQFKRWNFPSKQNPAHKNPTLVSRVQQLWERNTSQKDMLKILHDEGFEINERELMRLRGKNRWLLRVPNGMKNPPAAAAPQQTSAAADMGAVFTEDAMEQLQQAIRRDEPPTAHDPNAFGTLRSNSPGLDPEVVRKRQERLVRLQAESDERWASRKRRRRTRGWAGLPADPDGPPRFPSETTIDESKAYLQLDNNLYREMREQFQAICEAEGVIKKTLAGPEKWQVVKDRLITENPHLQHVIYTDQNIKQEQKLLSLDVICTDVTKRMRTLERRMTIAEAKNSLGINPEESRQIRNSFYTLLKADHFTSKLEAGDEHWNQLKTQWISESQLLTDILAPGPADPDHQTKVKAIEVLCRDVMKRLRDDQTKKDPSRKHKTAAGPGPGPAPPTHMARVVTKTTVGGAAPTAQMVFSQDQGEDMQIDPTLLLAANDSLSHSHAHNANQQAGGVDTMDYSTAAFASYEHQSSIQSAAIEITFRLAPHSHYQVEPRLWSGVLSQGSVEELKQLATSAHQGAIVTRVDGIESSTGQEVSYPIDDERDLDGYLGHVGGGRAVFQVRLARG